MKEETINAFDKFLSALATYANAVENSKGEKWIGELHEAIEELRSALGQEDI